MEVLDKPVALGVNFLLFLARDPAVDAALKARPPVFSAAWARADQDLKSLFGRAHDAGSKVMYMVGTVAEALRAKAAGADVIVAQGTEGGGHVGWMASMTVLPMIVDAVGSTPVVAAGGIADGRGLAAALALGAQGALLLDRLTLAEVVGRESSAGHLKHLTPREREVLELMARGLSNAAICQELHLSVKTVEPLIGTVFRKLGLHADPTVNRRVLAALEYHRG